MNTIHKLEELKSAAGVQETSYFNFALADGERLVATRYSSAGDANPASLHYTSGRNLRCEKGKVHLDSDDDDPDVALIASEETSPNFNWSVVPLNNMILAEHPGKIQLRPIPPCSRS